MPESTYIILGPDKGNVPSHWNRQRWQWVEGDAGEKPSSACVYKQSEIGFPREQYPLGVVGLGCLETGLVLDLTPPLGDGEDKI